MTEFVSIRESQIGATRRDFQWKKVKIVLPEGDSQCNRVNQISSDIQVEVWERSYEIFYSNFTFVGSTQCKICTFVFMCC